jgi:hypothetical protein
VKDVGREALQTSRHSMLNSTRHRWPAGIASSGLGNSSRTPKVPLAVKGTTAVSMSVAETISSVRNVLIRISEEEGGIDADIDLDVLFFDAETGTFALQTDHDDDIAFH